MATINLRIGLRILLIVVAAVVGMTAIAAIGLLRLHDTLLQDRQDKTQQIVGIAHDMIAGYEAQIKTGQLSDEDAKSKALSSLSKLRYGEGDYFWVNDLQGVMLSHPNQKLIGQNVLQMKDPTGKYLFQEFIEVGRTAGGGFVDYLWPKAGHEDPVRKLSYVKQFRAWGWIVGSGIYLDDVERIFTRQSLLMGGILLLVLLAVVVSSLLVSRG